MKYHHQFLCCLMLFLFSCNNKKSNQSQELKDTSNAIADTTTSVAASKKKGEAQAWVINQQASKVDFTISNFGSPVHGSLGGLQGTIRFDEKNLKGSNFDAGVKVNTINTGNNKRNKDLMHEKYFDEEHYPDIAFHSDSISSSGKGFVSTGHLTIKGKSKQKTIPFTFEPKGNEGIFKSQFSLIRQDYGIGGNGPIMGDTVNVSLEVVAEKK